MGLLRNHVPADAPAPVDRGACDAELVSQYKLGNAEAFALLYRRYVQTIYGFSLFKLGSVAAAEDATQSVFFRAMESIGNYREQGQFRAWLLKIANHVCTDELRVKGRLALPLEAAFGSSSSDPLPEEQSIAREALRALWKARQECLSEQDRRLYDLVVQDLTHQEIAAVLGKSYAAIRQAHVRLVERLRGCLGLLTSLKGGRNVAS